MPESNGIPHTHTWKVDRGKMAFVINKAVTSTGIPIMPDDLSQVVKATYNSVIRRKRIIYCRKIAKMV